MEMQTDAAAISGLISLDQRMVELQEVTKLFDLNSATYPELDYKIAANQ